MNLNGCGLFIKDVDIIHGVDDYITGTIDGKKFRVLIRYSNYGHPYFKKNNQRYYLSEMLKC
jgi:hypothetical protein